MNNSFPLVLLLLFPLFSQSVFSEDKSHDVIWMYEKISDADVFGKRDANAINSLSNIYSKVTINIGEKKLNIDNDFLDGGHVCSIDYVNITKNLCHISCRKKQLVCMSSFLLAKDFIFQNPYQFLNQFFLTNHVLHRMMN